MYSRIRAFTLVELMITLAIVAIVLSAGIVTMRSYIPKQRLSASASGLEGLFQRAQSEATARSMWTCIKSTGSGTSANPIKAELFADPGPASAREDTVCGTGDDVPITETVFKSDIIYSDTDCPNNVGVGCVVWFDGTGSPRMCKGSCFGGASSGLAVGTCNDAGYQAVLVHESLPVESRGKEVEVLSGGLIHTPKLGEKGLLTSLWVHNPTADAGDGCK